MKTISLGFVFLVSSLSISTWSADAARGKELYKACIQCHGETGQGNVSEQAPKIAGQYDWYIASSIKAFKKGVDRKNPKMLPFIKNLTDTDIADVSAYVASLKP